MADPKKAVGKRGSWFATVEGEAFPCVHNHWVSAQLHHDPFRARQGVNNAKIASFVEAVHTGKHVILTDDEVITDATGNISGFKRKAYIAVYAVEDVTFSAEEGLRFRLAERICDLQ